MKPINFSQSTKVLQRPSTMTDEECSPLPIWSDGKQCISCWKPTLAERFRILLTGKVWLGVLSGTTQPPVFVSGESVFEKPPMKARISSFMLKVKDNIVNVVRSVLQGLKQPDKRKHFIIGFAITCIVGAFIPWLGFGVACVAGAIKEWWDSKGHGTPEWLDFLFTCIGALCGFIIIYTVRYMLAWLLSL